MFFQGLDATSRSFWYPKYFSWGWGIYAFPSKTDAEDLIVAMIEAVPSLKRTDFCVEQHDRLLDHNLTQKEGAC